MPASKTVLLVEDEMLIAMDMEASLVDLGYDVTIVTDVDAALAALDSRTYHLAILDSRLRSGDCEQVTRRLREQGTGFIVCSGSLDMKEFGDVFANVPFLAKPFTADSLVQLVTQFRGRADAPAIA